ncbi:MAG: FtsX-like permease family protein [Bacteroidota bacterium]|nr:FtsX-like permease family protein [Bacteroidota bacterium]
MLSPKTDVQALESRFPNLVEKYKIGQINEHVKSVLALQPFTSIHLHSNLMAEAEKNGESTIVYSLLALAVFILVIALINYINLSTARSLDRAKEIGVRKVVGSGKVEIVKQYLTESLLTNFLALSVALLTIKILYPTFAEYTGMDMSHSLFLEPQFWVAIILILIFGGFAGGLHPAFILSSFDPVKTLKGKYLHVHQNNSWWNIRHTLVIFQFIISITLIAASMVVYIQLSL